ncbi:MAG: hypothetical protein Hyperionvirus26_4 [Hyperionvirus sp.]|uniref:Uncharacterized protein n=1 Tax=Hyperionvirus sp. TaxID=2487770 RepID=A0A3G5AGD0_9VIRU|nr:MAG: hypothetical protein Hyperionvirus26_4 [Hyperionvirus sp.]
MSCSIIRDWVFWLIFLAVNQNMMITERVAMKIMLVK